VKARLGIQRQSSSLLDLLTGRETVDLVTRLYPRALPRPGLSALIGRLGLDDKAASPVGRLSGGQHQQLASALALVNGRLSSSPTSRPPARIPSPNASYGYGAGVEGRTVVLSTHDMAEAEVLADRLVIIDRGRTVAQGPSHELMARHLPQSVVELEAEDDVSPLRGVRRVEAEGGLVRLHRRRGRHARGRGGLVPAWGDGCSAASARGRGPWRTSSWR
jgi:ABC-2 type transport system ATP-binding protein